MTVFTASYSVLATTTLF